jgi:hypothetical protein
LANQSKVLGFRVVAVGNTHVRRVDLATAPRSHSGGLTSAWTRIGHQRFRVGDEGVSELQRHKRGVWRNRDDEGAPVLIRVTMVARLLPRACPV